MGFEYLAEEKIREAMEQGAFDNLAGMGKPLNAVDDEFAGDNWMAFNLLRSNGFLPEWLELRKQIANDRDGVHAALRDWEAAIARFGSTFHDLAMQRGEQYRKAATAINALIDLHNLRCPSITLEIARFREDARPANYPTGAGSSDD